MNIKKWQIFSVCMMSCFTLAATTVLANTEIPATDPSIQYFGRWDRSAATAKTGRGATYIRTGFTGTSLAVRLKDKDIVWEYRIDNGQPVAFRPDKGETVLASSLSPGNHQLFLIRDTEGHIGTSEFSGLSLSDGSTTIPTTSPSNRRIEVIGDSITSGFWNLGKGDITATERGSMAYGPQLAKLLHAEWGIVSKSGEGVIHNYEDSKDNPVHAKDDYIRTFYTSAKPQWNFKINPPQAILVAYGTNDFVDKDHKPSPEAFEKGYAKLIRVIREKNPAAKIICLEPIPSWLGSPVRNSINRTVEKLQSKGDRNLYFIPINEKQPLLSQGDFADGTTHPYISGDTKIALYLKDRVEKIMGWQDTSVHVPETFLKQL